MTRGPDKVDDKGQRWEIRFRAAGETGHRTLGWSDDFAAATRMAAAWRRHQDKHTVWIIKVERWEIRYRVAGEHGHRTLGWSDNFDAANEMAAAWRRHEDGHTVWIIDRQTEAEA